MNYERNSDYKKEVYNSVYFIAIKTKNQNGLAMQGALSLKGDLMGGIFDRWINTIPEIFVSNKIILPSIPGCDNVKMIPDYYIYDPKEAGIAPDIIGISVEDKTIPFTVYNEKWKAVSNMPQIEVKTFKKSQKMISLRDLKYGDRFLVLTESDLRVDYLFPFFDKEIFSDIIYNELVMDDEKFIVSNSRGHVKQPMKIDNSSDEIGKIRLLKVTRADEFMSVATLCEENVSVQSFKNIQKLKK